MALSTAHFYMKFYGILKMQQPFLLPVRFYLIKYYYQYLIFIQMLMLKPNPLKTLSKKKSAEKLNSVLAIGSQDVE